MKDQAANLRELRDRVSPWKQKQVPEIPAARNKGMSIVISSGKGGVGKTHFSANLAIALARLKKKVILFDADMGLANVDLILGLHPEWHLAHVLSGYRKLREIIVTGPEGIQVVPASSGVERLANIDSIQLENLVAELGQIEQECDYLLVDTGAGIGHSVLRFAAAGDKVIVITTPEPAAFADAYAVIKCIYHHNPAADIQMIVNSCRRNGEGKEIFGKMQKMVRQFLKRDIIFIGEILYEKLLIQAARRQRPMIVEYPNSAYTRAVTLMARKVSGLQQNSNDRKTGYFQRFFSFLKGDNP